ncbi:MAG: hypothetical protein IJT44_02055 [Clostridia bacterium]|nr:hypothetical protein [Clostridia bacterium]
MSKKYKMNWLWIIFFFLTSFAYVTCFWSFVNPLNKLSVSSDVSCFYLIGRGILNGKIPYLDYIDNKGPVTYLIYAAAARIGCFPWDVFGMGLLCVFLSLLGIYVICRRLEIRGFYWVQLLFLISYALICPEGGYTEDLAIPFCIWSFLIVADSFKKDRQDAFVLHYGYCFAILFWLCAMTRVNNAVPIAAAAVCVGVRLFAEKKFKQFGFLVLSFLFGSIIVVTPVVLWLSKHRALKECLNQIFLNNFKYNSAANVESKREIFFSGTFAVGFYFILAVCLICIIFSWRTNKQNCAFLRRSALFITVISALSGLSFTRSFSHYLLCLLPALTFCLFLPFAGQVKSSPHKQKWLACVIVFGLCTCGVFVFNGIGTMANGCYNAIGMASAVLHHDRIQKEEWLTDWEEFVESIPEDERDSVLGVNVNPQWFIFSGLEPCKRMFICPNLFTSLSPEYAKEYEGYFQTDPPKWLITTQITGYYYVPGLSEVLSEKYQLIEPIGHSDLFNLLHIYHLKESECE